MHYKNDDFDFINTKDNIRKYNSNISNICMVHVKGSPGFDECVRVIRKTMAVVGLWPTKGQTSFLRQFHFFFSAVMMTFFIIIPQTRRAIKSHNDLNVILEVLTTADFASIIALIKHCGLWYNKQGIVFFLFNLLSYLVLFRNFYAVEQAN